jgi:hypothetical protein
MEPTREERFIFLPLVLPEPVPHSIALDDTAGMRAQKVARGVIPGCAWNYVLIFATGSYGRKKEA